MSKLRKNIEWIVDPYCKFDPEHNSLSYTLRSSSPLHLQRAIIEFIIDKKSGLVTEIKKYGGIKLNGITYLPHVSDVGEEIVETDYSTYISGTAETKAPCGIVI